MVTNLLSYAEAKTFLTELYESGGKAFGIDGYESERVYVGTEILPDESSVEAALTALGELHKKGALLFEISYES